MGQFDGSKKKARQKAYEKRKTNKEQRQKQLALNRRLYQKAIQDGDFAAAFIFAKEGME